MKPIVPLLTWLWLLGAPAPAEVVLRLGHTGAADSYSGVLARRYPGELTRRSGGQIRLSLARPAGGAEERDEDLALMREVLAGEPQLGLVRSSPLANFHRPMALLAAPYLSPEPATEQEILTSLRGRGLRGLALLDGGPRLFASRRPLHSAEDLVGLRVRVPQSLVSIDTAQLLGARPVPSAVGHTAEMARRGYVDGADLTYSDLEDLGLYGVFPYLLEPGHGRERLVVIINERFYLSLTAAQRRLLEEVGASVAAFSIGESRRRVSQQRSAHPPTCLGPGERAELSRRLAPACQRALQRVGTAWKGGK